MEEPQGERGPELRTIRSGRLRLRSGRRLTHAPHLLSDAYKKLVKRSGLPRIRLHDLRHTHATLLLKAGVPVKVVSERLGHSLPGSRWPPTSTSFPACSARPPRSSPVKSQYPLDTGAAGHA